MARWVEVRARTGHTTGEGFLERVTRELSVSGGMAHSDGVVDDDGNVTISFDPERAAGGSPAVLRWLDDLGTEYEATFSSWADDSD